jgi:hypothetical protein
MTVPDNFVETTSNADADFVVRRPAGTSSQRRRWPA